MPPAPRLLALQTGLAAIGFSSTIGQLLLLRELVAVFYGNELVFGLILAAWLAWVAVGAWGLPRLFPPRKPAEASGGWAMATGLVAVAILLPAEVALVRASRSLLDVTPGALVAFGPMMGIIVLSLAPLCLLLGWQFTLGARLLAREGSSLGVAYTAESLGAVAGGALFSFALIRWLDPFQITLLVGVLDLAVALLLARRYAALRSTQLLLALGVAALAILSLPLGHWLHWTALGWQYSNLRFAQDSIYGRLAVTGSGDQRVFFENGLLFFETQDAAAVEAAHLPLLAHPQPRRVLLIGGGVSGTLAEILRHPSVEAVHYVELDPLVVAAARSQLPTDQAAALDDPRLTLAHADGRLYVRELRRAVAGLATEPFDVVILDLPEPATGQLNRFYTQEFFAEIRTILAPGGLFALSLPWQENYPGPALQRLAASVYRTLTAEFPELALLPGEQLTLLASEAPLPTDPAVLSARLVERGIPTRWVVPSYLDYLLSTGRVVQAQHWLDTATDVRLNRDLEPICYFYDLAVWLSRFSGRLSRLAASASLLRLAWLAVPLGLVVLLLRGIRAFAPSPGRQHWTIPAVIALTGLAGTILEVAVLSAFQVVHGYVYGQVGAIVTAFMAGLALGSALANRWHWLSDSQRRLIAAWDPRRSPQLTLLWIQGGIALVALGFPLLVRLAPPTWAFLLLTLLSGGLTGLAFPVAVACLSTAQEPAPSRVEAETGRTAGRLYGADLVGGCLGAVMASVFLVPILGIPQTCLAVAMVGIAGMALLT